MVQKNASFFYLLGSSFHFRVMSFFSPALNTVFSVNCSGSHVPSSLSGGVIVFAPAPAARRNFSRLNMFGPVRVVNADP